MPDERPSIPIFPLDNVVLLPKVVVPLYIFEPRYRQMTRSALDGNRHIGMVVVRPDARAEMAGDPAVFPIGCEGVITNCQEQPDGTYKLALLGIRRFRIREEPARPAGVLFRSALIEPLADAFDASDRSDVAALREQVFQQMHELTSATDRSNQLTPQPFEGVDDETFVNALCQALQLDVSEKQGLVEADSVLERYRRLASLLRFHLAEMRAPQGQNSRSLH